MSFDVDTAVAAAGTHIGRVIRLLHEGVAFRVDGGLFHVFSHEGDELGFVSTADLNFAVCLVKRMGRQVGKCNSTTTHKHGPYMGEPAFTFAWEGWLMFNGQRI